MLRRSEAPPSSLGTVSTVEWVDEEEDEEDDDDDVDDAAVDGDDVCVVVGINSFSFTIVIKFGIIEV